MCRPHCVLDLPPVEIMPCKVIVVLVCELCDGGSRGGRGLEAADALDKDAEDSALGAGV